MYCNVYVYMYVYFTYSGDCDGSKGLGFIQWRPVTLAFGLRGRERGREGGGVREGGRKGGREGVRNQYTLYIFQLYTESIPLPFQSAYKPSLQSKRRELVIQCTRIMTMCTGFHSVVPRCCGTRAFSRSR